MRGNDEYMASLSQRANGRPHAGGRLWRAASLLLLAGLAAVGVSACGSAPEAARPAESTPPNATGVPPLVCGTATPPARPDPQRTGPPVTITGRANHTWDISTAVYKCGFDPGEFDYGLGVNVIRPIDGPDFLAPGDQGYPGAGEDFPLVGVALAGEARAYPIDILTRHEIVNDFIGDAHLAVSC
jgi:hypothetical protein